MHIGQGVLSFFIFSELGSNQIILFYIHIIIHIITLFLDADRLLVKYKVVVVISWTSYTRRNGHFEILIPVPVSAS